MIRSQLIEDIGFFDESLLACEDYDYWLRLSSKYSIHLMEESLMTKRAGHDDQLSYQFKAMDRFRIKGMLKMLESRELNEKDYHDTVQMLIFKCQVLITGCRKRNKTKETEYYQSIIHRYS